jgi:GGDEF domain-containing protein
VCSTAIEAFVRAVPSRMAALAVPTAENLLAIAATHGYPLELVEDIRFAPGEEIIGHVYRQPTPLRVDDIGAFRPRRPSRPRYRTPSFVALPIAAGDTVLGVVCLADRLDGQPFTSRDVSLLLALAGPASLALAGERAREQAVTYAHAAAIDPLSGLFNRRHLQQRLEEELQRAQRHGSLVGLLMLDIDNFKRINDHHGHVVGDEVIRDIADILRRSVRRFDVCARFGGEEFAVVMPGSSAGSTAGVAERIRQRSSG